MKNPTLYTDLLARITPRDNGNPAGIAAIERSLQPRVTDLSVVVSGDIIIATFMYGTSHIRLEIRACTLQGEDLNAAVLAYIEYNLK